MRTLRRFRIVTWRQVSAFAVMSGMSVSMATSARAEPAQASTATVRGVVVDQLGARIHAAAVSLVSLDTGASRTTESRADGAFDFVALVPGRYRLSVSHLGFTSSEHDLELTLDQLLFLPIRLVLSRAEAVTVTPTVAPLVDASKTSLGRTVIPAEMDTLPIGIGLARDFLSLTLLTPGVSPDVGNAPGIAANGQGAGNNTTLVDGLSYDGVTTGLPFDAIREFRVVSSLSSAEFGQASGAIVSISTRAGSNRRAGRVSWFHQDGAWNATSWAARLAGTTDPGLSLTSVSGFWGGPLVRDRAFLFAAADRSALHTTYINTSAKADIFRPGEPKTIPYDVVVPRLSVRGDVHLARSNILTLRYGLSHVTNGQAVRETGSTVERGKALDNPIYFIAASDAHVLGNSSVNEVRVLWSRNIFSWSVDGFCPGCATLNYQTIRLGKPNNAPQSTETTRLDVVDTMTWLVSGRGSHTIKAGVDFNYVRSFNDTPVNLVGTYTFSHDLKFDADIAETYPQQFTQNCRKADVPAQPQAICIPNLDGSGSDLRETILAMFVQDEWRPGGGLTINAGVRWDHTKWPGRDGPRRHNDVAPRLGIAFDPARGGVTVVRAGAGRFYDERALLIVREADVGLVQLTITNPGFQGDALMVDPLGFHPVRGDRPAVIQKSENRYGDTQTPYTDQVRVGLQHQVGHAVGITVDAVRARGYRQPILMDHNYPDPVTRLRPDPAKSQIFVVETSVESWYSALLVGARTRPMRGQSYSVAYSLVVSGEHFRWPAGVGAESARSGGRSWSGAERRSAPAGGQRRGVAPTRDHAGHDCDGSIGPPVQHHATGRPERRWLPEHRSARRRGPQLRARVGARSGRPPPGEGDSHREPAARADARSGQHRQSRQRHRLRRQAHPHQRAHCHVRHSEGRRSAATVPSWSAIHFLKHERHERHGRRLPDDTDARYTTWPV